MRFASWDVIPLCDGDGCPMAEHGLCDGPYDQGCKCKHVIQYLDAVVEPIFENFADELTHQDAIEIGMMMVPLYIDLVRIKMAAVDNADIMYVSTKTGIPVVNPLFKEKRQIIEMIHRLPVSERLRELALRKKKCEQAAIGHAGGTESAVTRYPGDPEFGDPHYVDQLYESSLMVPAKKEGKDR